ncbi:MAG: hypothetical protein KJO40_13865 [Deltaproteobacteria bacterium]|nr:hypothetical protein [Deltaproteobacteria bacterium]NND27254.1 hypothetical protein [Myxococcales bacterium]MBT8466313.1 hypothetical protein [Deltaproteobacteria bacterium]MBT8482604.1 hypothetical protein [Deltaproteobacteria bacterium]NNK08495.1 hypothetical protein [Myxococcales bacterium]
MGKLVAFVCLFGGVAVCAASLGLLPEDYVIFEAPRAVVFSAGVVSVLFGTLLLARDHRASDAVATILLLSLAAFTGWLTFYAPDGTVEAYLPFIPSEVNDALARLLFGLGAAATFGMAVWAVRRLFR